MTPKMTKWTAKLLADRFGYRARYIHRQWYVWCDDSDHEVEFDPRIIEAANRQEDIAAAF